MLGPAGLQMVSGFVVSWFPLGVGFLGVGYVWEEAGHSGWGGSRGARGGRGIGPFDLVVCVAALIEMG